MYYAMQTFKHIATRRIESAWIFMLWIARNHGAFSQVVFFVVAAAIVVYITPTKKNEELCSRFFQMMREN